MGNSTTPVVISDTYNADLSVQKGCKGLHIGWWIAVALGTGLIVGILIKELSKKIVKKKDEVNKANSN